MRVIALLLPLWLLAACDRSMDVQTTGTQVPLTERMAALPDPGFARAERPRAFRFPADHGPHEAFATEWWYFTGNLDTDDGRGFGYQLTLFRVGLEPGEAATDSAWRTNQIYMGHIAISDIDGRRHHSEERFSRAAAGLAGARADPLHVWLGPWSIEGTAGDTFPLQLDAEGSGIGLSLRVERGRRPLVLQGEQGLSRKSDAPGNASYYYSLTRLPTQGTLRIGGQRFPVHGDSWLDREWSSSALAADQAGWDWFALQLADGSELMYYRMRGTDGRAQPFSKGMLLDPQGRQHPLTFDDVSLTPLRHWQSEDGGRYPVAWRMQVPAHGLDLRVEALFDDQEMAHTVRYWEGAVAVGGTHSGRGYLELSGYARRSADSASDQIAQAGQVQ